ncbi:MAG: cytochrome P450 [Lasallia pustulata]|uniref:Cytochrome P450 n=1 Tax=Lasallia pustulata TaxID=136370 RepID=A0A5M8PIK7_9LECA|nr:MAG: cytochrome P450 [Lasallia pustulata]
MFVHAVYEVFLNVSSSARLSQPVSLLVLFGILWITWRIWRFTLRPALHPNGPKEIPYLVPFVGHALAFYKNFNDLVAHGRQYLGNTDEPFTLTIAGERIYIVFSPEDVSAVYRNNTTLEFDTHVQGLFKSFDGSSDGIRKLRTPYHSKETESISAIDSDALPPSQDSVGLYIRQSYKQQLQPGDKLNVLEVKIMLSLTKSLDAVHEKCMSQGETTLSIIQLTKATLLDAGTAALYGDQLISISPDFITHFSAFDTNSWMLLYHYPAPLAAPCNIPKRKVLSAFTAFFSLPHSSRSEVAQFLQTIEAEQRKISLSNADIASSGFIFYWAINSSPWKLAFWLLSYILYDPQLHANILAETKPAIRPDAPGLVDVQHLVTHCPHLEATFNETLRLVAASTSIRNVIAPTSIGSKVLLPGSRLLMPYRPMHFSSKIFGPHTNQFNPSRFLRNPGLSKHPGFRPWGGGSTFCPGRFLARREICAFVVGLLHRFDVEVVEGETFPRRDEVTPNLGIMEPVKGDDLKVRFRVRPEGV